MKFVIIGSGNISNTYINALEKINGAEITGIISRSGKCPSALKNSSGIEISDSLKKVKNDFDAVILCTPNGLHHKGAVEAASLGKHVLTEKPLDISLNSMNEMIEKCKQANVKLGVSYQRRFSPDNMVMKEYIRDNKIGKIFAADLSVKNFRDENYYRSSPYRGTWKIDGGGPFMQQASHYIDLYGWYFGKPDKIVSLYDTFTHKIEVEDYGAVLLKHNNGMIGTIIASTATKPGNDARLEIHSDKGTVIMENDVITEWKIEDVENPATSTVEKIFSGATSASVSDTANHEKIIIDFINSIESDKEPFVSGESAKLATEIILQVYNSKIN